jgi:putative transposase
VRAPPVWLWRSLKYEEVHLKAYANGLRRAAASANGSAFTASRPHQALGYKTPAAWAAEVSPVDLPVRLDNAGRSPTTPQGQQQQNVVYI